MLNSNNKCFQLVSDIAMVTTAITSNYTSITSPFADYDVTSVGKCQVQIMFPLMYNFSQSPGFLVDNTRGHRLQHWTFQLHDCPLLVTEHSRRHGMNMEQFAS